MTRIYKNIVILSGAGISAESGLSTFRAENGLWNNHKVEDVATVEGFARNPEYVHEFYNELKKELFAAEPNPAHSAITKLQNEYKNGNVYVITQNVDTLHEKAGNKNVFHIHGQINQDVCLNCGNVIETWGDMSTEAICPRCQVQGMIKPNIVFFGESLLYMEKVDTLLQTCDLFISVGTSGVVYPAAGFVQIAKMYGADTLEINLEETSNNFLFDQHITGKASIELPKLVEKLIAQGKED